MSYREKEILTDIDMQFLHNLKKDEKYSRKYEEIY